MARKHRCRSIRVQLGILGLALYPAAMVVAAEPYGVPRTHYGAPDLQGVWTNQTITQLQRPDEFDSLVITRRQAADFEFRRAALYAGIDSPAESETGELIAGEDPGGYNSFWMDEGTEMAVIDGQVRSSIIVDPEDGQIPYKFWTRVELFGAFRQFLTYDHPEQRPLGERCIVGFGSTGGPPMLPVLYNNHYQIVQTPGHVMILVEMNHDARIVRIGGEHPPADVRLWLGDSIGWWEDDTLVVETANFHPGQNFRAATKHFLYTSPETVVTERFTRTGDDVIVYQFTMDDPSIYRSAWTGELPLRAADGPILEYACHEGNYAMPGILAGAREEERTGKSRSWWRQLLDFALG